MNRSQFKSLVKECLVEILSEGLNVASVSQPQLKVKAEAVRRPRPALDSMRVGSPKTLSTEMKQVIKANAGNNDVMASILADTARTTLQEQKEDMHHLVVGGADAAALAIASKPLDNVFDEDTMNTWTALAFATPGPKV